ncbi:unnamed protein product [Mytilus coruscus]|uniref:ubiquitinyl hydrolase 1 n=1 Tax=Mytilus coruscus TaxID=42192 RepID=A0A6J8BE32_MYTCO|nr:unnamed protein product [Mytilus coruscus]
MEDSYQLEIPFTIYIFETSDHFKIRNTTSISVSKLKFKNRCGDGKHFGKFIEGCLKLSPEERAAFLEKDKDMGSAHEDSAQEGQTQAPPADEKLKTHFIAFVCKDGGLYELNGGCDGPVYHSTSNPDTLLEDAVAVAKKFMERDPDEVNFTLMALAKVE